MAGVPTAAQGAAVKVPLRAWATGVASAGRVNAVSPAAVKASEVVLVVDPVVVSVVEGDLLVGVADRVVEAGVAADNERDM